MRMGSLQMMIRQRFRTKQKSYTGEWSIQVHFVYTYKLSVENMTTKDQLFVQKTFDTLPRID